MARKNTEAMNLKEAAVFLKMSENTLRKLVREDKVPAQVFSKRGMRFSRTALEQWLRGATGKPAA
jgi:excisionase family DNA binding protein